MAGITLVTGPALEPVTLAEAKCHLRLTDGDADDQEGLIAGYVLAARQHVEDYCSRALIARTYDLKFDHDWPREYHSNRVTFRRAGRSQITLEWPPAISVTSISYVDTNGATQALDSALWQLSARNGIGVIVPAYGASWPAVRWQMDTVIVRYVAGYGSQPGAIPEPVRQAILMLISHYAANREAVDAAAQFEMPFGVRALLAKYLTDF